jgi:MFS family permease
MSRRAAPKANPAVRSTKGRSVTTAIRAVKSTAAMRARAEPLPLLKRQLTFLAAALFIVSLGYGALMPVLPAWLAQFPGSTDAADIAREVGFLSGAYAAGVLIGAPLWGYVSDRIGRRRILMIGMVGFVTSLLLLLAGPSWGSLWVIYALRTAAGLCVAAVIPVVPAIVAEHTPEAQRARRFAWLGAASLGGFLFGPALYSLGKALAGWLGAGGAVASADLVILMSAVLGAAIMLGLAWTLPARPASAVSADKVATTDRAMNVVALFGLSGVAMLVLSGFEVGIVLQGQQHAGLTTQQISLMFAECSLAMLAVNALLFFTSMLEKVSSRVLVVAGMLLSLAGLAILAVHEVTGWMYLGVSLTGAGIGLVLPVIAYLAAGASPQRLGATMGGITAAAGLGQVLGSAAGGWLFGELAQTSYGWLSLPLIFTVVIMLLRPEWGSVHSSARERMALHAGGRPT